MNNVLVYCELSEQNQIADIALELCTKGRQLATRLGCRLQAAVLGSNVGAAPESLYPYGVDEVFLADDRRLSPYRTMPHFEVLSKLIQTQQPQIAEQYDYYRVPTVFLGDRKLYEASPADGFEQIRQHLRIALDAALAS